MEHDTAPEVLPPLGWPAPSGSAETDGTPLTRDGLDPVAKLMRRARLELPLRLDKYDVAFLANVIIRQNLQAQVLTGIVSEYERALAEGGEEE